MGEELDFEYTVRRFLGEKAFHIAGQAHNAKSRKEWLRLVLKKIRKNIRNLDTSVEHESQLLSTVDAFDEELKTTDSAPSWWLIYALLDLVAALLGYSGINGAKARNVAFWQTREQFEHQNTETKLLNLVEAQAKIARQFKTDGYTAYQISQILNISETRTRELLKSA